MNYELSTHEKTDLLGFPIFTSPLEKLGSKSKILINTINQYSYIVTRQDQGFKKALMESDVLLPDGVGIVAAIKLLTGKTIKKIAGADLHQHLLEKLNREGGSCFYLGSSESTLNKIRERIAEEYPNVKVGTYSPPYKPEFSKEDDQQMIDAVNAFKPDVLFVGMTAPKQEKWAHTHKSQLDTKIITSIGAVFDFYAGTVERPGKIWINMGMEWLGRLVKEPKRLWKRYLYFGPVFVYLLIKEKANLVYNSPNKQPLRKVA
ncbi:WecB/TagA/CpsF family glycosyltransferase [Pedobacter sp. SYSU D00535]|uniref:WecB/TagA/CpsF family glycosyltransferase n=1 Tax=Pedobacter sp. SYSU D00535 TaxID=2810308 RepID=UPI001A9772CD|nr:WecB/TagA/CpsF family glycosyltransferase [Pedobacter sp. SYSU D00535]